MFGFNINNNDDFSFLLNNYMQQAAKEDRSQINNDEKNEDWKDPIPSSSSHAKPIKSLVNDWEDLEDLDRVAPHTDHCHQVAKDINTWIVSQENLLDEMFEQGRIVPLSMGMGDKKQIIHHGTGIFGSFISHNSNNLNSSLALLQASLPKIPFNPEK